MRRFVSIAALFSYAACGSDQVGQQGLDADTWSVDSVPELTIAGTAANGGLVFESASGATRLSDGTIVIADGLGSAVRFVTSEGVLLRTVGREGGGPGEFNRIQWLGQCSKDSVFV